MAIITNRCQNQFYCCVKYFKYKIRRFKFRKNIKFNPILIITVIIVLIMSRYSKNNY